LYQRFPGLAQDGYRETSQATWDYNCIAWAAADDAKWWEPQPHGFWPLGVPPAYTLAAYAAAYATLGYQRCNDGTFEFWLEKVVIFADASGVPTHAARQLDNGRWTSKQGRDIDIEHATPEALNGPDYGSPAVFMRRPRSSWRQPVILFKRLSTLLRNALMKNMP
jgi:hypothetical protein